MIWAIGGAVVLVVLIFVGYLVLLYQDGDY